MSKTNIKVPQKGKTIYGDAIIPFKNMLADAKTREAIRGGFYFIFGEVGLTQDLLRKTIDYCISSIRESAGLVEYERSVYRFLQHKGVLNKYLDAKKQRSSIRLDKVKKYLLGETVLDLGCGSGKMGAALRNDYKVNLADVYRNPKIPTELPFYKIVDGQRLPFDDGFFDNILVLSMLHHTQDPTHTLDECKRVLKEGGRLHLIETLYGISREIDNGSYGTNDLTFRSLDDEQQRRVTMFFDYFANHILDGYTEDDDKYIPVPFNFTTPDNLERMLSEKGFKLISKENLGVYPYSYVYHMHYVYSV